MIYQLSGLITEYDHCCLFNVLLSKKIKKYQKRSQCLYILFANDFLEEEMSDPLIG